MKLQLERIILDLDRRQLLGISDAAGTRVTCVRGCLWITQHHDRRDVILKTGESFELDRDGTALIHAAEASAVALAQAAPDRMPGRAARFALSLARQMWETPTSSSAIGLRAAL